MPPMRIDYDFVRLKSLLNMELVRQRMRPKLSQPLFSKKMNQVDGKQFTENELNSLFAAVQGLLQDVATEAESAQNDLTITNI